ncbi:MAG: hypothetical protein Tsb005_08590 [Gammaproteobacteria bacterium]
MFNESLNLQQFLDMLWYTQAHHQQQITQILSTLSTHEYTEFLWNDLVVDLIDAWMKQIQVNQKLLQILINKPVLYEALYSAITGLFHEATIDFINKIPNLTEQLNENLIINHQLYVEWINCCEKRYQQLLNQKSFQSLLSQLISHSIAALCNEECNEYHHDAKYIS